MEFKRVGGDEAAHKFHTNRKKTSEEEKARDKTDDESVYITFDFQQIIDVPRLATGSSFYMRKLTLFNLCFHVTMPDKSTYGFCYPWTEVDGQRGGNEIASCLHHFLTTNPLMIRRN